MIRNPEKPPRQFSSWRKLWIELKENNLTNEITVRIFSKDPINIHSRPTDEISGIEYEFSVNYIKAKCFEEIEAKEPEDLTMEMCSQLFYVSEIAKQQMSNCGISEWIKKFAQKNRNRLIETKQH